jgi:hypothetical protein
MATPRSSATPLRPRPFPSHAAIRAEPSHVTERHPHMRRRARARP